MKYASIDIETLGLNIDAPIIEVACVFVDNGEILGEEQTYVCHDKYDNCEPYAMAMHPETLKIIADGPKEGVVHINDLDITIRDWLTAHEFTGKVTYAGKNAAGFDLPMLKHQCQDFTRFCKPRHRALDPGPMFAKRGDDATPNLSTILEQQELAGAVTHTALDDARAVVSAVERFFDLQVELDDLRGWAREVEGMGLGT